MLWGVSQRVPVLCSTTLFEKKHRALPKYGDSNITVEIRSIKENSKVNLSGGDFFGAFWAWHDLTSFLIALTVFTTFWSMVTALMLRFQWYVETLGMVSLLVEASLGAPQLIRNCQRKSTQGMSTYAVCHFSFEFPQSPAPPHIVLGLVCTMVLAWLCGDLAKTGYFVATGSPIQFWVCAILQISIDVFILGQVFVYRKNTETELPYSSNSPAHSVID
ncbi:hypothetical protein OSTOST_18429 [Ostertagia ostertagi]